MTTDAEDRITDDNLKTLVQNAHSPNGYSIASAVALCAIVQRLDVLNRNVERLIETLDVKHYLERGKARSDVEEPTEDKEMNT